MIFPEYEKHLEENYQINKKMSWKDVLLRYSIFHRVNGSIKSYDYEKMFLVVRRGFEDVFFCVRENRDIRVKSIFFGMFFRRNENVVSRTTSQHFPASFEFLINLNVFIIFLKS